MRKIFLENKEHVILSRGRNSPTQARAEGKSASPLTHPSLSLSQKLSPGGEVLHHSRIVSKM